ncbi:ferrous iron transport protein A [Promethearchaeum syntrophicum]|uniref:Ferrous iron transport protein A n=1 Tax=Promethearchaeum syntrophicum TaxID=2594042 RepID=A0A5B9D9I1_9ARCH|nr:FeoA family protein [Candidatus Prometheoarchaeum syntrophicum]
MVESKNNLRNLSEIPINNIPLDTIVTVSHIRAGLKATQRLSGMGITPGVQIKVISQAPFRGPIQIIVRGTRLAIGAGLAMKIFVYNNFH